MNSPDFIHITFRRQPLYGALTTLRPLDVVLLLAIVVHSHPRGGRVWSTTERLAAELGLTESLVTDSLERLIDRKFLTRIPSRPPVLSLEVSDLLVREGEAPENLPLEPTPV